MYSRQQSVFELNRQVEYEKKNDRQKQHSDELNEMFVRLKSSWVKTFSQGSSKIYHSKSDSSPLDTINPQKSDASSFRSTTMPTMPKPPKPPDPPDVNHSGIIFTTKAAPKINKELSLSSYTSNTRIPKLQRKYTCEEIYERMELGLCVFCDEHDTPDHHLKHKRSRIVMIECGDDISVKGVTDDNEMTLKHNDSVLERGIISFDSPSHGVPATQYQDTKVTQQKGPIQNTETFLVQDSAILDAAHTEDQMVKSMMENPKILTRKINIPAFDNIMALWY